MDTREMKEIEAAVEGILFASGEPVGIDRICVALDLDKPTAELVLQRLQAQKCRKVLLVPLLLTGGRHVAEDMAGNGPSSWKSRLEAAGISVRVSLQGLAEHAGFRQLYLNHIRDALS